MKAKCKYTSTLDGSTNNYGTLLEDNGQKEVEAEMKRDIMCVCVCGGGRWRNKNFAKLREMLWHKMRVRREC